MTKCIGSFQELTETLGQSLTKEGFEHYSAEDWYDLKALAVKAIFSGAEALVIDGAYTTSGQDLVVVYPNNRKFRKAVGY